MAESDLPSFSLPTFENNVSGWGPVSLPQDLKDLPYAPFSKGDRLGRVADWTNPAAISGRHGRYDSRWYQTGVQNTVFTFADDDEESGFHLVDNRPKPKPSFSFRGRGGNRGAYRGGYQQRFQSLNRRHDKTPGKKRFTRFTHWEKPQRMRESSVEVQSSWTLIEEIEFAQLTKLSYDPESVEEIRDCGTVFYYERAFDKLPPKTERPLTTVDRVMHNVTTSDDPIIEELAKNNAAQVFGVDSIIALLMVCSRSVYSWDIIINRIGDKLFFDKRPGSQIDFLTVCETATDVNLDDKDPINSADALSVEATFINRNFTQQVLNPDEKFAFQEQNPFAEASEVDKLASVGYRYRKFNMGDYELIVRTEVDGVMKHRDDDIFLTIRALNEFDPKFTNVDWRKRIDTQRGAVFATELKNNAAKLCRWTAEALLAGTDQLKLGYVSRSNPKDNSKHVILGTQFFKPGEFASQIHLSESNSWGIVKTLIDRCLELPEGRYLLLKDPSKPLLRLYETHEEDGPTEA